MRTKKMMNRTLAVVLAAVLALAPAERVTAAETTDISFEEVTPESEETLADETAATFEGTEAPAETAETALVPSEESTEAVEFSAEEPAAEESVEDISVEEEADVYETVTDVLDPDGRISVEFQLAPEAGMARFSDKAIQNSLYLSTTDQTSVLVRYASERVDGIVRVANGETIGGSFTKSKDGVYTEYPSLDPIPQGGFRAVFLGWHVSFSQSKLYTSDELAKLKITGPTFVWAEWSTEDVVAVTFENGADTLKIRDSLRREDTTDSIVKYVKKNTNLRDLFLTSSGWKLTADPAASDKDFYGWKDADNEYLEETDWNYAEDTTLVPIYRPRTIGVTGIRVTKVKANSRIITGHEVWAYTGEEVKLTATVLGGSGKPDWTAVDDGGVVYNANKSGVIKNYKVTDNNTVCSFLCRSTGTVTITASYGIYKDTVTVNVTPALTGVVWGDVKDPASKEATAERKMILYDKCYQSGPGTTGKELVINLMPGGSMDDKIYITTSNGFAVDDFFTLKDEDGREFPFDEASGTGASRKRVAQAKNGKIGMTVSIPFPVSGETRVAHAGSTTVTFASQNGKYKLVCKLIVAGYDEAENVFYQDTGEILKDQVRRLYAGDLSPFANSVDYYFDVIGHAHKSGLVRKENGTYILIDDKKEKDPGQQAFVVNTAGKVVAGAYAYGDREFYIDKTGEVKSGWMSFTNVRSDGKTFDLNKKYYDAENGYQPLKNRFVESSGAWYFVGDDGFRLTGRQDNPDGSGCIYFFQEKVDDNIGKMQTGWVKEDSVNNLYWWYDKTTGARAPTNAAVTDGTTLWYQSETRGRLAGAQIDSTGWVWLTAAGNAQVSASYPDFGTGTVTGYYIVDKKTGALAKNKLVTTSEGTWYFGEDGLPVTGTRKVGKTWYCFDGRYGQDATTDVTAGYFLRDNTGAAVSYRLDKNDKATYQKWVDASRSVLDKRWIVDGAGDSYYIVKGKMVNGWQTINGDKYYFDLAGKLTAPDERSLVTIDGKRYYLDSRTASLPGRLLINQWVGGDASSDYYVAKAGTPVVGKQTIVVNGVKRTFFFNTDTAKKLKGVKVRVGKALYYLNDITGAVETGSTDRWHDASAKDFYITKAGVVKTGWVTINEGVKNVYYFTADGEKLTGLQENTIAAKTLYYLNETTGVRMTNVWLGKRYFDKNGKALVGRNKVNGAWYIFQDNGERYEDVYYRVGNVIYYLDSNGVARVPYPGDYTDVFGDHYVVKSGGRVTTGLVTSGKTRRFYNKSTGVLACDGFYLVDKKWGYFDEYGVQQTTVDATVRGIGEDADEGNLFLACDAKTGLITAFKDDAGKKLTNVKITLANGQQYIVGKDGTIATGWYSFRNPRTRVLYHYYVGSSGRLDELCTETLAITKGTPLLKVDGLYYYQTTTDGILMTVSGVREAYDNGTATGYYVNTRGEVQFSKKIMVGTRPIFVDATGHRANGWYRNGGAWYYISDGSPVKNRTIRLTASMEEGTFVDDTMKGFVNTATGERLVDLNPVTSVNISGKQNNAWTDAAGNKLTGTWEADRGDGTVAVISFSKGVLQVGKLKVYDSVTHATVKRTFDEYTGCATYKK